MALVQEFAEMIGKQFVCTSTHTQHTVTSDNMETFGTHNVGSIMDGYEARGIRCPDCKAVVHMIADNKKGNYLYHVR